MHVCYCLLRNGLFAAEMAPECARSYYLYGTSLLEKARSDTDVFGAELQDAAEARTKALIDEALAEPGPADEGA